MASKLGDVFKNIYTSSKQKIPNEQSSKKTKGRKKKADTANVTQQQSVLANLVLEFYLEVTSKSTFFNNITNIILLGYKISSIFFLRYFQYGKK